MATPPPYPHCCCGNAGEFYLVPMPRKQTLKVYRTAIGFHDAYVAAPSQKAALEAWGSDANLFARGMAELVTDEEQTREPLAQPGKVVRRLRGTTAEQIAALPPARPAQDRSNDAAAPAKKRKAKPERKPVPKPDRAPVDQAAQAIEAADTRYEDARRRLAEKQAELDRARHELDQGHEKEVRALRSKLEQADAAYRRAMDRWRG